MKKRKARSFMALVMALTLVCTGCGSTAATESEQDDTASSSSLAKIDNSAWSYDEDADVYYQVGISYCENPADEDYETLGIFVPGAYMTATDNGDGTYTCEIDETASVEGYTAETAPIVIPVNTPGYSAMAAPTEYSSNVTEFTDAGFVYVWAGCRGRDDGIPAGVTDLKAAIRYIRYNEGQVAGDMDRIFSFGMSGGGAQSALLGSTGDSDMYTAYLEEIGAVMDTSDAVAGSMCWCPITSLDIADEAYEWNMGVTRSGLSDDEQALSDDLASAFADYINAIGLKDSDGNVLTLEESEDGIYQAGSYYDYVLSVIEESLENFLSETEFPYSASSGGGQMAGGAPAGDGQAPSGEAPTDLQGGDGQAPSDLQDAGNGQAPSGEAPSDLPDAAGEEAPSTDTADSSKTGAASDSEAAQYAADGISRDTSSASTSSTSETYETAQDYIDALNADNKWVTYDASTGGVTITSIADFAKACKNASKSLGAFDQLDCGQGENTLFGYGDGQGVHFDSILAELIESNDYGADYAEAFETDLAKTDSQGNTVEYRSNMYNPLYFLSDYYDGYGSSTVAQYWRIRTGINQSDTALSTEINLALALEENGEDVDFATIWGQGHTQAESAGDSDTNFIEWVNECLE